MFSTKLTYLFLAIFAASSVCAAPLAMPADTQSESEVGSLDLGPRYYPNPGDGAPRYEDLQRRKRISAQSNKQAQVIGGPRRRAAPKPVSSETDVKLEGREETYDPEIRLPKGH